MITVRLELTRRLWRELREGGNLADEIGMACAAMPQVVPAEIRARWIKEGYQRGWEEGLEQGIKEGKMFKNSNDLGIANAKRKRSPR